MSRGPAPDGFAELAIKSSYAHMQRHYVCSSATIKRWLAEVGIDRSRAGRFARKDDLPADFAERARRSTANQLCGIYGCKRSVIDRWSVQSGVKYLTVNGAWRQPGLSAQMATANRDMTQPGQAADFLRRLGPVIRCDAAGAYSATGDHWKRNGRVLTADDVVERALALGWDPDAWKRIAPTHGLAA
jgi:hypothetical protein